MMVMHSGGRDLSRTIRTQNAPRGAEDDDDDDEASLLATRFTGE